jgi:hypothetical protein
VNVAWKANLENIFFEREKALLPATQGVVEMLIENEKRVLEVRAIDQQIKELTNQRAIITNRIQYSELAPVRAQTLFIRPCGDGDCRGFLNSAWNCGLCQKSTCNECHLIKKDDHVCNADDVATAKLLKSDTKPCPKCSTGIYKIDGCDQMWCIECKTAFSWKSGEIVNGKIHNPHYYEYLRKTQGFVPRADNLNPCQEVQTMQYIRNFFTKHRTTQTRHNPLFILIERSTFQLCRFMEELRILHNYEANRHETSLVNNRIQFLINRIDEKKFSQDAFMYFQRSVQYTRYVELITMLRDVTTDLYGQIIEQLKNIANLEKTWTGIQTIFLQILKVGIYFNAQHTKNAFTSIREDHTKVYIEMHSYDSVAKVDLAELSDINEAWVGTKENFIYFRYY